MNYYDKYIKYKMKYTNAKLQIGGGDRIKIQTGTLLKPLFFLRIAINSPEKINITETGARSKLLCNAINNIGFNNTQITKSFTHSNLNQHNNITPTIDSCEHNITFTIDSYVIEYKYLGGEIHISHSSMPGSYLAFSFTGTANGRKNSPTEIQLIFSNPTFYDSKEKILIEYTNNKKEFFIKLTGFLTYEKINKALSNFN
jgi:hypothetical protein